MKLRKTAPKTYTTEDPADDKIKIGQVVEVKKTSDRSLPDLRMFFAIAENVCLQKIDGVDDKNLKHISYDMIKRTMLANGLCDTYAINGKQYSYAWSLQFGKTEQEKFNKVRNVCYETWSKWCGCTVEELTGSVSDVS